jgi:hypothetical protein
VPGRLQEIQHFLANSAVLFYVCSEEVAGQKILGQQALNDCQVAEK